MRFRLSSSDPHAARVSLLSDKRRSERAQIQQLPTLNSHPVGTGMPIEHPVAMAFENLGKFCLRT